MGFEDAEHGGGGGDGGLFFDAAHHHAEVLGFEDDGDALRVNGVGDGVGDLTGEALLHLEAAGEDVDDAGDLGPMTLPAGM